MRNAQAIASLVDDSANVNRARNNFSSVLGAISLDFVPGGFRCHSYSLLELFGGVDIGVVNPFFVLDFVVVCFEQISLEVEGFDFLF